MSVISNSCFLCLLPSGEKAVFSVEPQHINMSCFGEDLNDVAIKFGKQIAHCFKGEWFKAGTWEAIADNKTISLLERCPNAWA